MNSKKRGIIKTFSVLVGVIAVLIAVYHIAAAYGIGNVNLFAFTMLIVPSLCLAVAAFILGFAPKWSWKRGLCIAVVLALLSFGTMHIYTLVAGTDIAAQTQNDNSDNAGSEKSDMDELYDELDRKAYEYMLEQGLIKEGEEIHGGDITQETPVNGKAGSQSGKSEASGDSSIAYSEMYAGIQTSSDPTTELLAVIADILLCFGASFLGCKAKKIMGERKEQ